MATSTQKSDFITKTRQATTSLIEANAELNVLLSEWNALDLINEITDEDFTGDNAGLTTAELAAVIGTTLSAINALMAQGHATNLYKISY